MKTIETAPSEEDQHIDHGTSLKSFDEESSLSLEQSDLEAIFNHRWGYLPPLGEEAEAVIEAIMADSVTTKDVARIGPYSEKFPAGLRFRNVALDENKDVPDMQADQIRTLPAGESFQETVWEKELQDRFWASDHAKCNRGSNEALFQRTVMMHLISRHSLIYDRGATHQSLFDFSVEEPWTCPPMPTRAYLERIKFLTQPKPDLAVCFRRHAVIPDNLWMTMPAATKGLACYENTNIFVETRIFHFFTIEAKKGNTDPDDDVGKFQSLNNASQALHNSFQFCKDAGGAYEDEFFTKARFFSVVASTKGLIIRIHRATRLNTAEFGKGLIMEVTPGYPLKFEFQEYKKIEKGDFNRKVVSDIFQRILVGYEANELYLLLQNAAKALMERLSKDLGARIQRQDPDFYRYGQTIKIPSKRPTPASGVAPSAMSVDMRDKTETPAGSGTQTPVQMPGAKRKPNTREPSMDAGPAKRVYKRKKPTNP